jgi:hypothetical protein
MLLERCDEELECDSAVAQQGLEHQRATDC